MWEIVVRVFTWLVDKELEKKATTKLGSWILKARAKYKKYRSIAKKVKNFDPYQFILNPTNWFKFLKQSNAKEIKDLMDQLKDLENLKKNINSSKWDENNPFWEWKTKEREWDTTVHHKGDPGTAGTPDIPGTPGHMEEYQTFIINNRKFAKQTKEMDDELNGKAKWVNLSSSWLKRGIWKVVHGQKLLGNLTIETKKSPKHYTYPMVPYDVWVMMKQANGYNGTSENPRGAGSVFWKYWLHVWLPSALRARVYRDLEKHNITSAQAHAVWDQTITRAADSFYHNKTKQNSGTGQLSRNWYINYNGGNNRASQSAFKSQRYITYTQLYAATNRKMVYRSYYVPGTPTVKGTVGRAAMPAWDETTHHYKMTISRVHSQAYKDWNENFKNVKSTYKSQLKDLRATRKSMNDTIHKIKTAEQLAKNPFGKMKSMANSSIKKGMKKQGFNFKKPTINRVMNHFFGKKKNNKKK